VKEIKYLYLDIHLVGGLDKVPVSHKGVRKLWKPQVSVLLLCIHLMEVVNEGQSNLYELP